MLHCVQVCDIIRYLRVGYACPNLSARPLLVFNFWTFAIHLHPMSSAGVEEDGFLAQHREKYWSEIDGKMYMYIPKLKRLFRSREMIS